MTSCSHEAHESVPIKKPHAPVILHLRWLPRNFSINLERLASDDMSLELKDAKKYCLAAEVEYRGRFLIDMINQFSWNAWIIRPFTYSILSCSFWWKVPIKSCKLHIHQLTGEIEMVDELTIDETSSMSSTVGGPQNNDWQTPGFQ